MPNRGRNRKRSKGGGGGGGGSKGTSSTGWRRRQSQHHQAHRRQQYHNTSAGANEDSRIVACLDTSQPISTTTTTAQDVRDTTTQGGGIITTTNQSTVATVIYGPAYRGELPGFYYDISTDRYYRGSRPAPLPPSLTTTTITAKAERFVGSMGVGGGGGVTDLADPTLSEAATANRRRPAVGANRAMSTLTVSIGGARLSGCDNGRQHRSSLTLGRPLTFMLGHQRARVPSSASCVLRGRLLAQVRHFTYAGQFAALQQQQMYTHGYVPPLGVHFSDMLVPGQHASKCKNPLLPSRNGQDSGSTNDIETLMANANGDMVVAIRRTSLCPSPSPFPGLPSSADMSRCAWIMSPVATQPGLGGLRCDFSFEKLFDPLDPRYGHIERPPLELSHLQPLPLWDLDPHNSRLLALTPLWKDYCTAGSGSGGGSGRSGLHYRLQALLIDRLAEEGRQHRLTPIIRHDRRPILLPGGTRDARILPRNGHHNEFKVGFVCGRQVRRVCLQRQVVTDKISLPSDALSLAVDHDHHSRNYALIGTRSGAVATADWRTRHSAVITPKCGSGPVHALSVGRRGRTAVVLAGNELSLWDMANARSPVYRFQNAHPSNCNTGNTLGRNMLSVCAKSGLIALQGATPFPQIWHDSGPERIVSRLEEDNYKRISKGFGGRSDMSFSIRDVALQPVIVRGAWGGGGEGEDGIESGGDVMHSYHNQSLMLPAGVFRGHDFFAAPMPSMS